MNNGKGSLDEQLAFIASYFAENGLEGRVNVVVEASPVPAEPTTEEAVEETGNDGEWEDEVSDASSDDDADPSGPKTGGKTAADKGRTMVALVDFSPGDIIFTEPPLLHTSPNPPIKGNPFPAVELPRDWQRLLQHYVHICTGPEEEKTKVLKALDILSTDGVTSPLARKTDPERIPYYRSGAKAWLEKLRARAKKSKTAKKPPVTIDDIERLVHVIETNCHSRDKFDPEQMEEEDEEEELDMDMEEEVGVYFAGSFLNHSCLPNASATLNPSVLPDSKEGGSTSSSPDSSGKPGWLTLRCISPIKKGEIITISYTDESFMPAMHRQARLTMRGFKCKCELCTAPDVFRAVSCGCKKDGTAVALPPSWKCGACGQKLADKIVSKVTKMEGDYLDLNDQSHDQKYQKVVEALFKKVNAWYRTQDTTTKDIKSLVVSLVPSLDSPHAPLHASHWLITTYARDLIESGVLNVPLDEMIAARLFLVSADLFSMGLWNKAHESRKWEYSEDLHHDLMALRAAVEAKKAMDGDDKLWEALGEWAGKEADAQERVLGG